jgi:hypothetical protein
VIRRRKDHGRRDSAATEIAAPIVADAPDDRDVLYVASRQPNDLPAQVGIDHYRHHADVTWHQRGEECTGFALAAIANYELRRRLADPALPSVSRRMLYEVAQLHDGEDFDEGSTLRGALKGWRLTGVTLDWLWPYAPDDEFGERHGDLTLTRLLDARHRPLAGYRRVPHHDLDLVKDALASGHALFAAARFHVGWYRLFLPDVDPTIRHRSDDADKGGHAFAIVGYDDDGLWIHNSWGPEWGADGYARLPYDDWLERGLDAWVVDVGSPTPHVPEPPDPPSPEEVTAYRDMWPHLVVLRDDGRLASEGLHEMDDGSVRTLLYLFGERTTDWERRRLVVVSDAGHRATADAIEAARTIRDRYMAQEIYPIFVLWETSWWADLVDEYTIWLSRLSDGIPDGRIDPADDLVRAAVKASVVGPIRDELRRRARRALEEGGGGARLVAAIDTKREKTPFDLHLVSHGAGDHLQTAFVEVVATPIASATAIASSTSTDKMQHTYVGALADGRLGHLVVVSLDDDAETADGLGPIAGSPLLVERVVHGEDPFGAGERNGEPWDRLRREGRLTQEVWEQGSHVDLGSNVDLHERLASVLVTHLSRGRPSTTSDPGSARSEPHRAPDSSRSAMPTDPLAYAEAARARRS